MVNGVYCATATPLADDGSVATDLLIAHAKALLDEGCNGLAPLGTTGEAVSLTLSERKAVLEAFVDAGIAPEALLPGVGAAAIADVADLSRHALSLGITQVLMLPPFYYKPLSDEALFTAFAQVVDQIADPRLKVLLYHIPHISGVAITHDVIERLRAAYPGVFVGIKDSSGKWDNLADMKARFPSDFAIMTGADPLMGRLLEIGGAGCITGAANVMPEVLRRQFEGDDSAQATVEAIRSLTTRHAQIPSLKALIAHRRAQPSWRQTRAPLLPLGDADVAEISADLDAALA